jgi:hypothetical protein
MARVGDALPGGVRISDLMSVTVLASVYPPAVVNEVLVEAGRQSQRHRALPATLMVYYVMALAIYMQVSYEEILRVVVEAFRWFAGSARVDIPAKSSISEARNRLGPDPVRLLVEKMVRPVATEATRGAFYRGWRLVSLDGSTMDIADTVENEARFGRPGVSRGSGSAFPQIRFCSLLENGTHILFGTKVGAYEVGEITLAHEVVENLTPGTLCFADRNFFGFELWSRALKTGADLVWRVKKNLIVPVEERLWDGSYISSVYPSIKDRSNQCRGVRVRVIEYRLRGDEEAEDTLYRLLTTVLDPVRAPASDLAELYTQRWEIETTLDEFKTHLRGRNIILRSKTPDGVLQEFWGFLLAHYAIRKIMHDAALKADVDPDRLSFVHALRTVQRRLPFFIVAPPSGPETAI